MSEVGSTILENIEATLAYGTALAAEFHAGDVVALHGVLGSGKTQLVKGIAAGLEFTGDVTSPTFTILHEYTGGRVPLYHLDLYRLETPEEVRRAGLEDYLPSSDGVTLVEWPERAGALLPETTRHFRLEVVSLNERLVSETL